MSIELRPRVRGRARVREEQLPVGRRRRLLQAGDHLRGGGRGEMILNHQTCVEGCSETLATDCVKLGEKVAFCLPSAGR